jgi:Lrp/AsnC family transcriptional regulator, leucine-responsive regulatory protein
MMNAPRSADTRMDDLDRRLIAELQEDPRISYADLGKRLGVSGMTAATRLNRLRAAGLLRLRVLPEYPRLGLATQVLGFVQVEMAALSPIIDVLQASPFVLEVNRIVGEFDLSFRAVFPSEITLGRLVRDLQALEGLRRLVVHHVLDEVKQEDGWSAVFLEEAPAEDVAYEVAPGVRVPKPLEGRLAQAATWVDALAKADHARLRELSDPAIVFTIMPPHPAAGVFDGMEAVLRQAERTRRAYRRLWYRIIGLTEGDEPYELVIDALSPVETGRGRVGTAFSRMAFGFAGGKIVRVMSVGAMDLHGLDTAEAQPG